MENKLDREISDSILFIGCEYIPPKGGIAVVLENYDKYLFSSFKFIANSKDGTKLRKATVALFAVLKMCCKLIIDKRIKIVHIHTASGISFKRSTYFPKIARIFKKKVILHIHGGNFKQYYKIYPSKIKSELMKCDKIIALTNEWKVFFESEIGLKNVEVVENIVPYPQRQDRKRDKHTHLLYLGLIHEDKGIYDLLEVINNNKQVFRGSLRVHIGGNGEIDNLLSKINQYGIADIVSFEGWVDGKKKIDLLNSVDALILPSYIEGLPMVILEAMSYGLPILSTHVGGIPEVVNDMNGILFTPGDTQDIYRAITQFMLYDAVKRKEMGAVSIKKSEMFFPDAILNKLTRLYQGLLTI